MSNIYLKCINMKCHFHNNPMPWPESTQPIQCPVCRSNMEIVEGTDDRKETEDTLGWLRSLAESEEYWIVEAETAYPSVVAYEYRNLRHFCREGHAFAVLLSLKDNFEALLKLEVLLAFAWAAWYGDDVFEKQTISRLMTPNPSLGTWVELASVILKDLKKAEMELPACIPLEKIRIEYEKKNIVNWRNEKIGHGAMSLSEDEEFQKDIREKVMILKGLYGIVDMELREQELYLPAKCVSGYVPVTQNTEGELILTGADMARGLSRVGAVHFRQKGGEVAFCVDPFITIRRHEKNGFGIYYFDNQRTRSLTYFLAYAEGSRSRERLDYFERLRRYLDDAGINPASRADDIYLTEDEIREMDELQMSHGFVKPDHLVEWLKVCIGKHEKGVFLLQMERGTGKSIFAEQLSGLTKKSIQISDDLDVRTYHFSRTQTAGSEDIRSVIEWLWGRDLRGGSWVKAPRISDYEAEGKEPARALCAFLEEIQRYSIAKRGKNRILTVLDGLDEIAEEVIWEFIPREEMLGRGIYILLTSSDPYSEELPGSVRDHLRALRVTERYCVGRKDDVNEKFLREYIKRTEARGVSSKDRDKLLLLSDHRVLQLGMLCRLVENGMSVEELPDHSKVAAVYLDALESRYGEKEAVRLRELLAVLCALGRYEDLTVRSMGVLTGENGLTLNLIGMLRDLAPMLKKERGEDGNQYAVANPGLADEMEKQIPEVEDTVRWIVDLVMSEIREEKVEKDLEIAAIHLVDLADEMLPEGLKALGDNADEALLNLINLKKKTVSTRRDEEILMGYRRQLFLYRKKTLGEEDFDTLDAQEDLAKDLRALGYYEEALEMRKKLFEVRKRKCGPDDRSTLKAQANVALLLSDLGRHEEALQIRQEIYEKRKRYFGPENRDTLRVQSNLAVSLSALNRHEEALLVKQDVLEKRKKVLGEEHPDTLRTQSNLAVTLRYLNRLEEALSIERDAYEKKVRVLGADDRSTLLSLSNVGIFLFRMGRFEEALSVLQEAYDKRKVLLGTESSGTLLTQFYLASTLEKLGDRRNALKMFRKIYEVKRDALGDVHMRVVMEREGITDDILTERIEGLL